jgi:hypothetical protein
VRGTLKSTAKSEALHRASNEVVCEVSSSHLRFRLSKSQKRQKLSAVGVSIDGRPDSVHHVADVKA